MSVTASVIVTIIVIAFLAFFLFWGLHRGILRILFSTFSIIVVIALSYAFVTPVANWLQNSTFVGSSINLEVSEYVEKQFTSTVNSLVSKFTSSTENKTNEETTTSTKETTPANTGTVTQETVDVSQLDGLSLEEIRALIEKSGSKEVVSSNSNGTVTVTNTETNTTTEINTSDLDEEAQNSLIDALAIPEFIKNSIKGDNNLAGYAKLQVSNFKDYLTAKLSGTIIKAIAFILLMIAFFIITRILMHFIKFIDRLPVIGGVNRLLGGILGLVEALIILWILGIILMALAGTDFGTQAITLIHGNKFLSLIYDNNMLLLTIKTLFISS